MARPMGKMTALMENVIRAEARGEPWPEIYEKYFGLPPGSDRKKIHAVQERIHKWRKRLDYNAIWEDELAARVRRRVPGAISRIDRQIDGDNDWLANKAANDYLGLAKTLGVIKSEETAVKVEIGGLPELGVPDPDDA